jgi:hypothetical protein
MPAVFTFHPTTTTNRQSPATRSAHALERLASVGSVPWLLVVGRCGWWLMAEDDTEPA